MTATEQVRLTAVLLPAALAYDWQGNLAHELIGTAMFALLIAHNTVNRRWYGSAVRKGGRDLRGWLNIATIATLAVAKLILLVTSIIISRSLFSFLPIASSFGARQLHAQAAYWALVIVGVHVGMRWTSDRSVPAGRGSSAPWRSPSPCTATTAGLSWAQAHA